MKNDKFFEDLKELNFDIAEPNSNHQKRFLDKLNKKNTAVKKRKIRTLWVSLSGVAAALLITFSAFSGVFNSGSLAKETDLATVSPEMRQTQDFYSTVIEQELKSLKKERSEATSAIIDDALEQLQKLETEYQKLKKDLSESGKDKRVIYAMISNFQKRIDLLNHVLEQIQTIKQLKKENNETNII